MTTTALLPPTRRLFPDAPAFVYRMRRFMVGLALLGALSLLSLVWLFATASVGGLGADDAVPGTQPVPATVHVVQPGETLWSIAEGLTPSGHDVRAVVDELARVNGGPDLQAGQRLSLGG